MLSSDAPRRDVLSVLVVGVGGQGVQTLWRALGLALERCGLATHGALVKGGAQQMGTVYGTLRAFPADAAGEVTSEIAPGALDVAIGLEPWETLRFRRLFGAHTCVVAERDAVPLYLAARRERDQDDPAAWLDALRLRKHLGPFAREAHEDFGDRRMANFVAGSHAIARGWLATARADAASPNLSLAAWSEAFDAARAKESPV